MLRLFFNKDRQTQETLPWIIHDDETGLIHRGKKVISSIGGETEEKCAIRYCSPYVMSFDGSIVDKDGILHIFERSCN